MRADGEWRLIADDAYAAGEQCFISYGERDNLKLLLQYGFAVDAGAGAPKLVIFDVADLIDGCVAARPHIFAEVKEMMLAQMERAQGAPASSAAAAAAEPFQRLSLFLYDGDAAHPRENLQAALGMLEGVVEALGEPPDMEGFRSDVLQAMLDARLVEVTEKLTLLERDGTTAEVPMRDAVATLLRAERTVLSSE